jgi:hypothetical protein
MQNGQGQSGKMSEDATNTHELLTGIIEIIEQGGKQENLAFSFGRIKQRERKTRSLSQTQLGSCRQKEQKKESKSDGRC